MNQFGKAPDPVPETSFCKNSRLPNLTDHILSWAITFRSCWDSDNRLAENRFSIRVLPTAKFRELLIYATKPGKSVKRCHNCERIIPNWFSYCPMCRRFTWRLPHIIILTLSILIIVWGLVWIIEYIASRWNLFAVSQAHANLKLR